MAPTVPSGSVQIVVLLHSFVFVLLVSDLPLVYSDVPKSIIGTFQSVVPVVRSQFLSTSLWRVVPSIGTIVGLTLLVDACFSVRYLLVSLVCFSW